MTPAALAAAPPYHCTACGERWTYAEIRYVAACRRCGSGLTRTPDKRGVRGAQPPGDFLYNLDMTQIVEMYTLHGGTPRDLEARGQLAAALGDAEVTEPDDVGVFEIHLEAEDKEHALQAVWNAIAASGTDDHIVFFEHPDLPEHWRRLAGGPAS
jgi:DNA-directed RNA polymerase subunit RPC12/RpoP